MFMIFCLVLNFWTPLESVPRSPLPQYYPQYTWTLTYMLPHSPMSPLPQSLSSSTFTLEPVTAAEVKQGQIHLSLSVSMVTPEQNQSRRHQSRGNQVWRSPHLNLGTDCWHSPFNTTLRGPLVDFLQWPNFIDWRGNCPLTIGLLRIGFPPFSLKLGPLSKDFMANQFGIHFYPPKSFHRVIMVL